MSVIGQGDPVICYSQAPQPMLAMCTICLAKWVMKVVFPLHVYSSQFILLILALVLVLIQGRSSQVHRAPNEPPQTIPAT